MPSPDRDPLMLAAAVALGIAGTLWLASRSESLLQTSSMVSVVPHMTRTDVAKAQPALLADPDPNSDDGLGRFRQARGTVDDEIARLEAIGYLSGSREAGTQVSVVRRDAEAWEGLNLYNSGHRPEAVLMDMDGQELHRWTVDFRAIWPDWAAPNNENMRFWRRVHLFPDGSLLGIFEGLGLVKLDRDSNILWAQPNSGHHDLEVLPDGSIAMLSRRVEMAEEVEGGAGGPTLVDYVIWLDPEGRQTKRVSLLTAYRNSPSWRSVAAAASRGSDVFHTNSISVLHGEEKGPFREGNLLLSMRHLSTLAVLNPDSGRIVWSRRGPWRAQHDPQQLDDGRILIFDNGPGKRRASEVLELDPKTGEIPWRYQGTEDEPFWSATCGTAQRLPNGNTLITESDAGRAFEVTRDGTIVWEFFNPNRPADQPELVATLFEVKRLPSDFGADWLTPADGIAP